jgi:hypothetical protein
MQEPRSLQFILGRWQTSQSRQKLGALWSNLGGGLCWAKLQDGVYLLGDGGGGVKVSWAASQRDRSRGGLDEEELGMELYGLMVRELTLISRLSIGKC